jgi:hypothetical protein
MISVPRRKVWLCVLSRRSSTICGKFASEKKSERLFVLGKTKMSFAFYAIAVRGLRRNEETAKERSVHYFISLSNTQKFVDRLMRTLLINYVPIWKAYFQNLTTSLAVTTS